MANSTLSCADVPRIFNLTELGFGVVNRFAEATRFGELVTYYVNGALLITSIAVTGYYMKFRIHEFDRLKARSFPLVVAGHMGALVQLHTGSFAKVMNAQVPCNWLVIFSLIVVPLILLPFSARIILLKKQDFITKAAAQGIELDEERPSQMSMDTEKQNEINHQRGTRRLCLRATRAAFLVAKDLSIIFGRERWALKAKAASKAQAKPSIASIESSPSGRQLVNEGNDTSKALAVSKLVGPSTSEILMWRYSASSTGTLVTLLVVNVPFFALALVSFPFVHAIYFTSCTGCVLSPVHGFFIVGEGVLAVILTVYLYWTSRHQHDPFGILQEIRWCIVYGAIPGLVFFILNFIRLNAVAGFSFNMLVSISLVILSLIQGWFQVLLALRDAMEIQILHEQGVDMEDPNLPPGNENDPEEGRREDSIVQRTKEDTQSRLSWNTSPGVNYSSLLQVVLSDPVLRNAFHAHLCEEHNVEPMTFLDAIERWKRHFPSSPKDTSHNRAKRIMKNFVGHKAPFPIALSSPQVDQLIRKTARPDGLTIDAFEGARQEVLKSLEFGPLIRFVKTSIFRGFVDDGLIMSPDQYRNAITSRRISRNSSLIPPPSPELGRSPPYL